MEVITVNRRQVIKCVHCAGDGICKHSTLRTEWDSEKNNYVGYRECQKCGKGMLMHIENPYDTNDRSKPPICAICEGKGYTIV